MTNKTLDQLDAMTDEEYANIPKMTQSHAEWKENIAKFWGEVHKAGLFDGEYKAIWADLEKERDIKTDNNNLTLLSQDLEIKEQELRDACRNQLEILTSLIYKDPIIHPSWHYALSRNFEGVADLENKCKATEDFYKEISAKSIEIAERIAEVQAIVSLIKDELAFNKSN